VDLSIESGNQGYFTAEKDATTIFLTQADSLTGGKISTFTSWGPSYEGWIKPQISALVAIYFQHFLSHRAAMGLSPGHPWLHHLPPDA
jgi:hypothetical protein